MGAGRIRREDVNCDLKLEMLCFHKSPSNAKLKNSLVHARVFKYPVSYHLSAN